MTIYNIIKPHAVINAILFLHVSRIYCFRCVTNFICMCYICFVLFFAVHPPTGWELFEDRSCI